MNPAQNSMLVQSIAKVHRLQADHERMAEVLMLILELAEADANGEAAWTSAHDLLHEIARLCGAALVGVTPPE